MHATIRCTISCCCIRVGSLDAATDGNITLFQANSVSSTPALDMQDLGSTADQPIATHEGCLEDVVTETVWSSADPWVFAGVSHSASVYCDMVPEKEKLKILL